MPLLLTITPDQFNSIGLGYGRKVKNNVMRTGFYSSLYYSTKDITISNIPISIKLNDVDTKETYGKRRIFFPSSSNTDIIKVLSSIEYSILHSYNPEKKKVTHLCNTLHNGNVISLHISQNSGEIKKNSYNVCFKISGIWETDDEIGIIYKCYSIDS